MKLDDVHGPNTQTDKDQSQKRPVRSKHFFATVVIASVALILLLGILYAFAHSAGESSENGKDTIDDHEPGSIVLKSDRAEIGYPQMSGDELRSGTGELLDSIFKSGYWRMRAVVMSSIPSPNGEYYESWKADFNGFREFAVRKDAVSCLWKKYTEEYLETERKSDIRWALESMLLSDDFYPGLTDVQRIILEDALESVYG